MQLSCEPCEVPVSGFTQKKNATGNTAERWVVWSLLALLGYAAWVRGGAPSGYQPPLAWLAAAVLIATFVSSASRNCTVSTGVVSAGSASGLAEKSILRRARCAAMGFLRDPVTYAAIIFHALLLTQWANAGRTYVPSRQLGMWVYRDPGIPWLPSAVSATEAREMLYWFFPAFVVVLAIRHGLHSRRAVRKLLRLMVLNAAAISVFGIVQFMSGTKAIYWRVPLQDNFFASFGYLNHAGQYFVLMLCVTLALTCYELFDSQARARGRGLKLSLLIAGSLLCLVGANLSLSVAAILFSWTVVLMGALWLLVSALRRLRPSAVINLSIALLSLTLIGGLTLSELAERKISKEVSDKFKSRQTLMLSLETRSWQWSTAVGVWKDYPWFGAGGWGYRYFAAYHLPRDKWKLMLTDGRGNAHNDALQFLCEFGLVGFTMLTVTILVCCLPIFKTRIWEDGLSFMCCVGLFCTLVHSQFDLPFRLPAILCAWLAILAGIGRYLQLSHAQESQHRRQVEDRDSHGLTDASIGRPARG